MPNYAAAAPVNWGNTSAANPFANAGNWPGSAQGKTNPSAGRQDYAVWNAGTQTYQSVLTGQPYSGTDPFTGKQITNGKEVQTGQPGGVQVPGTNQTIDPNDPNQRYKPVDIVKDPAVAGEADKLTKQFSDAAATSLKDFGDYLNTFKQQTAQANKASQAATDVGADINALQQNQKRYDTALGANVADLNTINAQNADAESAIVQQAKDLLPSYDAAAQAVADRQQAALQGQLNRYSAGSGSQGASSDMQRMLLAGTADIQLPTQLAKVGRQYDLLSNLALPVQRDITNRATSAVTQFNPYAESQQYGSFAATTQQIQGLKSQVANMTWDNAVRYMQSMGIPPAVQSQVLGVDISQLGSLAGVRGGARYQGLQDVLGVDVSQPVGASFQAPAGRTYTPRYNVPGYGGGGAAPTVTGSTNLGGNAPVQVGGAAATSPWGESDPNRYIGGFGGGYYDMSTGDWFPYGTPAIGPASNPNSGPAYVGDVNIPDTTYA